MIYFIYNLFFVFPAKILIPFFSFFNDKIKKREKNWRKVLDDLIIDYKRKRIWFHSASMGEFEQAKSVIEAIKQSNSDIFVITSFYSPSGYENQKNYCFSDAAFYLPFDTKKNSRLVLNKIQPDCCIFVRYDLWLNLLTEINKRKIPALLINATKPLKLSSKCFLFKAFIKKVYSLLDEITTVGQNHTDFFKKILPGKKISTLTDTRFDRIINQIETSKKNPVINRDLFCNNEFILIAGSTWEEDEQLIWKAFQNLEPDEKSKLRIIFVPHEPRTEHIKKLTELCGEPILLGNLIKNNNLINDYPPNTPIIVDSIGKLLSLYGIADFAYVGGGFGAGIHSVTEPAGYGIPIATGQKINNSPDAIKLFQIEALKPVKDSKEFLKWLSLLMTDREIREKIGKISKDYILQHSGSTSIVVKIILDSVGISEHS